MKLCKWGSISAESNGVQLLEMVSKISQPLVIKALCHLCRNMYSAYWHLLWVCCLPLDIAVYKMGQAISITALNSPCERQAGL